MILDLSAAKHLFADADTGVLAMKDNVQVDQVEHVIIRRGDWDPDTADNNRFMDAELFLEHIFNEHKCPNLRQLTLEGLLLPLIDLSWLSITCHRLRLTKTKVMPFLDNSNDIYCHWSGCVTASVAYRTVRCPGTGRLLVSMDDFWEAVEGSVEPLDDSQISRIITKIPDSRAECKLNFEEFCKK